MPWKDESTPPAFLPALQLQRHDRRSSSRGRGYSLLVAEIVVKMQLRLKCVSRWGRPEET
jgi:hypothetical protein